MRIAGNPRIFGPILSSLCFLLNLAALAIFLNDLWSEQVSNYLGTPNQTYILSAVFGLNAVYLVLALYSFWRRLSLFKIFKPVITFQVLTIVLLIFVAPFNYILIAVLLSIFSWVFGAITLASSNLDVEKVSSLGIYEISEKK